eukprot:6213981-Pyramimonas_sp.AAC.5
MIAHPLYPPVLRVSRIIQPPRSPVSQYTGVLSEPTMDKSWVPDPACDMRSLAPRIPEHRCRW